MNILIYKIQPKSIIQHNYNIIFMKNKKMLSKEKKSMYINKESCLLEFSKLFLN